jgi:putative membrane protein
VNSLQLAYLELKRFARNKVARKTIIAICLMPLLYSYLYLNAFWDPYSKLSTLPVAVVNEDQGGTYDGAQDNFGQRLSDNLKANKVVGWEFVDRATADNGLQKGKYYLALVIPKDFTSKVLTATGDEPEQAELLYLANQSKNYLATQVGNRVMSEVKEEMAQEISSKFFENIVVKLQDSATGLREAADGAQKLADGSRDAKDGTARLTDGIRQARDGSEDLGTGSQQALDGANQLVDGLGQAKDGTLSLKDGINKTISGAGNLQDGLSTAKSGTTELLGGLQSKVIPGSNALKDGLNSASQGSLALADGLNQLTAGAGNANTGSTQLNAGLGQFKAALNDNTQGFPALVGGAGQLKNGITALQHGTTDAAAALTASQNYLQQYAVDHPEANSDPNFIKALAYISGTKTTMNQTLDPNNSQGFTGLNGGAAKLYDSLSVLLNGDPVNKLPGVNSTLDQFIAGSAALRDGTAQLSAGLGQAVQQTQKLASGLGTMYQGASNLSEGLQTASLGVSQNLLPGLSLLYSGSGDLRNGLGQLSVGSGTLVNGLTRAYTGEQNLAGGLGHITDGAERLHIGLSTAVTGTNTLADGIAQIQDGNQTLATKLSDAAQEMKVKSQGDATKKGEALAKPVKLSESDLNPVNDYGTGFTPYFVPLALWVGALILFFLVSLKENRLTTGTVRGGTQVLSKFFTVSAFGVIQAVVSSWVLLTFLPLHPQSIIGFYLFNILLSWTFIAIIQLLVYLLGAAGRFLAIVLLMLQLTSCAGTFPLELVPRFFRVISPWLPMTYGTAGLRQIISGSAHIPLSTSLLVLASFLVGALVLNILATSHWVKLKDLHPVQELAA